MKNLKKILSLVLVVVMVFSMATIAGAKLADFTDADSIPANRKEAIDLLSGVGVLDGFEDGTFGAGKNLTREQAAKIICYLLVGKSAADKLVSSKSSFTDVAATRWSSPFIEYCVLNGIINGVGNDKFAPTSNVTYSQFAKMLLTALGYGKLDEYVGPNWEISTIVKAQNLGILGNDIDADYSSAANRGDVAQAAFNAFTLPATVAFNKTTEQYIENTYNVPVPAPGTGFTTHLSTLAHQQNIVATDASANGVSGYKWTRFGKAVSDVYLSDNVVGTSTNGTLLTTVAGNLGLTERFSPSFIAALDAAAEFYINGDKYSTGTTPNTLSDANTAIVRGSVVTLIDNVGPYGPDGIVDKVVIVNKDGLKLTAAPVVNATTGAVTLAGINGGAAINAEQYDCDDTLAVGDYVLYYQSADGVFHIEKAASVNGQITRSYSNGSVLLGGATYFPSGLTDNSSMDLTAYVTAGNFYADSTAYLDDGGSIIAIERTGTGTALNYAVLLQVVDTSSGWNSTIQGMLLLPDGTTKIVTLSSVNNAPPTTGATVNVFYSYVEASDGTYALTAVASPATISAGSTITGKVANFTGALIGDASTAFLLRTGDGTTVPYKYVAYRGISNLSNINAAAGTAVVINGIAKYVYLTTGTPSDAVASTAYILSANYGYNPISPNNPVANYEFDAIVDGEITTVKVTTADSDVARNAILAALTAGTNLVEVTYTNGVVTSVDDTVAAVAGVSKAGDGIITIGSTAYTFNSNTEVFTIQYGVATKIDISAVTANATAQCTIELAPNTADTIGTLYIKLA